eukprot:CAMPEP_0184861726 /NCGR_PEP_ID=MMETSP0580-20130426/6342_1 /TAXON_ID=1118495 /ORGANISM="Dactyliosolen fragilissimus" /LENGTH=856 /DNA_ID=CAMNT_0027359317 /DNA_START=32 /DNA_END=2602 /DNA_ORIENTATION=+
MALFLPPNVKPLPSAQSVLNWSDDETPTDFFVTPNLEHRNVAVDYVQLNDSGRKDPASYVQTLLDHTPKPKGRNAFTSVHLVGPALTVQSNEAEKTIDAVLKGCNDLSKQVCLHRLNEVACTNEATPMEEYNGIFEVASSLLLEKADRASLLVFVGWEDINMDSYAAFIGMLPFRGIQVALISRRSSYGNLVQFTTPSGTFDLDGLTSARMGKFTVHCVFGELPTLAVKESVRKWEPVDTQSEEDNAEITKIPFKIGGLELPMLTHNGTSEDALDCLAELLKYKYPKGYTPIVSCGETCDALGYGQDMLNHLAQDDDLLFAHKSGETYKRYDNYGSKELFKKINDAKRGTCPPVILAVGGGVNGNCIGLIAAMTNVDFIEVPTTPMHYNDAVTSAKKAFSLVVDDRIMSKNILGAFYLPQLAFCVNEWLLTISSANAHATVGEATKTMNMLGIANSSVGATDFHNILGAVEFASDFTKILSEVGGFDELIKFIQSPSTIRKKKNIITIGKKIAALRNATSGESQISKKSKPQKKFGFSNIFGSLPSMASISSSTSISSSDSSSDSEDDQQNEDIQSLMEERSEMMKIFRSSFYNLPSDRKDSILSFLTTINKEIVCAKAMFLAYSDPFEKYRALLFEYAHTLGHGVEAFANDMYLQARQSGVEIPTDAIRLHGQCVGMAVLWAGEMSKNLGKLVGEGYTLHQSFPFLFNRSGGFSFGPLRELCEDLCIEKEEFCERVLQVVRRDNKRGYCNCSDPEKSVDQLVTCRPGKMLSSPDPNAEVRYLVEVDESWQRDVLSKAFNGEFDRVADIRNGNLTFVPSNLTGKGRSGLKTPSKDVALHIRSRLLSAYSADVPRQN